MQRPQRTMIKSTKIFPYNSFRKILAPEHFLQELENCITEQIARHPRNNAHSLHPGALPAIHNAQELLVSSEKTITSVGIRVAGEGNLCRSLDVADDKQVDNAENSQSQCETIKLNINHANISINRRQSNGQGFRTAALKHENKISLTNGIICKRNISSNSSIRNSVINGTSFKIRNFGGIRENRIEIKDKDKDNINCNSYSRKAFTKPLSCNKNYRIEQNQAENIQHEMKVQQAYFQECPPPAQIQYVCQKLTLHKVPHQSHSQNTINSINHSCTSISHEIHHHHYGNKLPNHCSQFYFIVSQSIFYGSLLEQANILKLSTLCQSLQKLHPKSETAKIHVYVQLYEQSEGILQKMLTRVTEKGVLIDGFIMAGKCIQSVNVYDIGLIHDNNASHQSTRFYTVIEDTHEAIHNYYYDSTHVQQQRLSLSAKWLYIRARGYPNTIKLFKNSTIIHSHAHAHSRMCLQTQLNFGYGEWQYHNWTDNVIEWKQIRNKIEVYKFVEIRKKMRVFCSSHSNQRYAKDGIKEKQVNQRQRKDSKSKDRNRNKSKDNNQNERKSSNSPNKNMRNSRKQIKQQPIPQQKQNKYDKIKQRIFKHAKHILKQHRPSSKQKQSNDRKCSTGDQKSKILRIQTKPIISKQKQKQINRSMNGCNNKTQFDETVYNQIHQLLKNNVAIFKQVSKYYDKCYKELKQYQNHLHQHNHNHIDSTTNMNNKLQNVDSGVSNEQSSSNQRQDQHSYQQQQEQQQYQQPQQFAIEY